VASSTASPISILTFVAHLIVLSADKKNLLTDAIPCLTRITRSTHLASIPRQDRRADGLTWLSNGKNNLLLYSVIARDSTTRKKKKKDGKSQRKEQESSKVAKKQTK
jgi:hypothetical protein